MHSSFLDRKMNRLGGCRHRAHKQKKKEKKKKKKKTGPSTTSHYGEEDDFILYAMRNNFQCRYHHNP